MKKLYLASALAVLGIAVLMLVGTACTGAAQEARGPAAAPQFVPTAVPPHTLELVKVFMRDYQGIGQEWDRFNSGFDQWRAGLTACDRFEGQNVLDGFAARASQITQDARKLPRPPVLRDLANQVVQTAEKQETSLRQLRDSWQPANPATYEGAEAERAAVARLRQQVQDSLYDLRIQVESSAQPSVREFSSALQSLNATWDGAHQNFDTFRTQSGPEAADRLNQAVVGIGDVVAGARGLPSSPATSEWAWSLAEAAAAEDQALRKLREPAALGEAKALANADAQVLQGNAVRGRVQRQVVNVLNTPEDNEAAVKDFNERYTSLGQDWDRLQQDYDGWRHGKGVGACDAKKAIEELDQFVKDSASLARRAQSLPSGTLLRSLKEPLSDAASRQAEAIKALRGSWRPYATDLYKTLEQERANTADLRRQVDAGVQDLQARLGPPAQGK